MSRGYWVDQGVALSGDVERLEPRAESGVTAPTTCESCGCDSREIGWSEARQRWTCLACHLPAGGRP